MPTSLTPIVDGAIVSDTVVSVAVVPGTTPSILCGDADLLVWLDAVPVDPGPAWVGLPSASDARHERRLRRFVERAGAGGPGGAAVPWRRVDLDAGGQRLRLVTAAGGAWQADLLHWLPKVLSDEPTVLVANDGVEAEALRAVARRHSSSLLLVVSPGDPGFALPDGPWAELIWWTGEGFTLTWTGDSLQLVANGSPVTAEWTTSGGWSSER